MRCEDDEEGVEEVERDLAVRGEVRDLCERCAVVLAQVVQEDADGREDVVFLGVARFAPKGLFVPLEEREEGDEELRVKLRLV